MSHSRTVTLDNVKIGGGNPIAIQTMWDESIQIVDETLISELNRLELLGCKIIRFAVPDEKAVPLLKQIKERITMPVVADIHFDYKLALQCMQAGIPKIRINPGNIGAEWKVREVIQMALDTGTTLRVGANSGSLPVDLRGDKYRASALVKAATGQIEILESMGFTNYVVSMKSSSVEETLECNRLFRKNSDAPLHIGVTEAGPLITSLVKSTLGLAPLLKVGIGDTIRISITGRPDTEVMACKTLLAQLGLAETASVNIISCPQCGRNSFDTVHFMEEIQNYLYSVDKDISVAVMGCAVNGPGEARHADLGITGAGNSIMIFKKGDVIRRVERKDALEAFKEEVEKL